jgi:hypothetical protein
MIDIETMFSPADRAWLAEWVRPAHSTPEAIEQHFVGGFRQSGHDIYLISAQGFSDTSLPLNDTGLATFDNPLFQKLSLLTQLITYQYVMI